MNCYFLNSIESVILISGIHQFELEGAPGLYFMEVKSESGSQFLKLIKK